MYNRRVFNHSSTSSTSQKESLRERKKLQRDFFKAAGPNTAAFRALIDTLPDDCFYMKDLDCRIMALNRHRLVQRFAPPTRYDSEGISGGSCAGR